MWARLTQRRARQLKAPKTEIRSDTALAVGWKALLRPPEKRQTAAIAYRSVFVLVAQVGGGGSGDFHLVDTDGRLAQDSEVTQALGSFRDRRFSGVTQVRGGDADKARALADEEGLVAGDGAESVHGEAEWQDVTAPELERMAAEVRLSVESSKGKLSEGIITVEQYRHVVDFARQRAQNTPGPAAAAAEPVNRQYEVLFKRVHAFDRPDGTKLAPGVDMVCAGERVVAVAVEGDWIRTESPGEGSKWYPVRLQGFGELLRPTSAGAAGGKGDNQREQQAAGGAVGGTASVAADEAEPPAEAAAAASASPARRAEAAQEDPDRPIGERFRFDPSANAVELRGLTPGATYRVKIFALVEEQSAQNLAMLRLDAVNGRGGSLSKVAKVTMPKRPPAPGPVVAEGLAALVEVSWKIPKLTPKVTHVELMVADSKGTRTKRIDLSKSPACQSTQVRDLDDGTRYSISVRVQNQGGWGPSAMVYATTHDKPSAPAHVAATAESPDTISLRWATPDSRPPVTHLALMVRQQQPPLTGDRDGRPAASRAPGPWLSFSGKLMHKGEHKGAYVGELQPPASPRVWLAASALSLARVLQLEARTTYEFMLYARNDIGISPPSDLVGEATLWNQTMKDTHKAQNMAAAAVEDGTAMRLLIASAKACGAGSKDVHYGDSLVPPAIALKELKAAMQWEQCKAENQILREERASTRSSIEHLFKLGHLAGRRGHTSLVQSVTQKGVLPVNLFDATTALRTYVQNHSGGVRFCDHSLRLLTEVERAKAAFDMTQDAIRAVPPDTGKEGKQQKDEKHASMRGLIEARDAAWETWEVVTRQFCHDQAILSRHREALALEDSINHIAAMVDFLPAAAVAPWSDVPPPPPPSWAPEDEADSGAATSNASAADAAPTSGAADGQPEAAVRVQVPAGATPGTTLSVAAPDGGEMLQVVVPDGAVPGQQLQITAPKAPPGGAGAPPVNGKATWEFEADDGQWQAFAPRVARKVEAAYKNCEESVHYTSAWGITDRQSVVLVFETMQQTNTQSGTVRRVRRTDPGKGRVGVVDLLPLPSSGSAIEPKEPEQTAADADELDYSLFGATKGQAMEAARRITFDSFRQTLVQDPAASLDSCILRLERAPAGTSLEEYTATKARSAQDYRTRFSPFYQFALEQLTALQPGEGSAGWHLIDKAVAESDRLRGELRASCESRRNKTIAAAEQVAQTYETFAATLRRVIRGDAESSRVDRDEASMASDGSMHNEKMRETEKLLQRAAEDEMTWLDNIASKFGPLSRQLGAAMRELLVRLQDELSDVQLLRARAADLALELQNAKQAKAHKPDMVDIQRRRQQKVRVEDAMSDAENALIKKKRAEAAGIQSPSKPRPRSKWAVFDEVSLLNQMEAATKAGRWATVGAISSELNARKRSGGGADSNGSLPDGSDLDDDDRGAIGDTSMLSVEELEAQVVKLRKDVQAEQRKDRKSVAMVVRVSSQFYPEILCWHGWWLVTSILGADMGSLRDLVCERRLEHYDDQLLLQKTPHVVRRVTYGGRAVVLKEYKITGQRDIKTLRKEVITLQQLAHPHIIKVEVVFYDKKLNSVFVQLPYYQNHDMARWLETVPHNDTRDQQLHSGLHQILRAIEFMHARGIAHCDVKPENIFVHMSGGHAHQGYQLHLVLADFDLSLDANSRETQRITTMRTTVRGVRGTRGPLTMPQEVLDCKRRLGVRDYFKVDIFCFGGLLYVAHHHRPDQSIKTPKWARSGTPGLADIADENLALLLGRCLNQDPSKRPSAAEALSHPHFDGLGLSARRVFQEKAKELQEARDRQLAQEARLDAEMAAAEKRRRGLAAEQARLVAEQARLAEQKQRDDAGRALIQSEEAALLARQRELAATERELRQTRDELEQAREEATSKQAALRAKEAEMQKRECVHMAANQKAREEFDRNLQLLHAEQRKHESEMHQRIAEHSKRNEELQARQARLARAQAALQEQQRELQRDDHYQKARLRRQQRDLDEEVKKLREERLAHDSTQRTLRMKLADVRKHQTELQGQARQLQRKERHMTGLPVHWDAMVDVKGEQWEWLQDHGSWKPFSPLDNATIAAAAAKLRIGGQTAPDVVVAMDGSTVDLKKHVQVMRGAGGETTSRRVRCIKGSAKEATCKRVLLSPHDSEYMTVLRRFRQTVKDKVVVSIERVQLPALWRLYTTYRDFAVSLVNNGTANEKLLFHGTSAATMDRIAADPKQCFDRNFGGKNATLFGKGTYFARDAKYSAGRLYSPPDDKGDRRMYLARVAVGTYTKGSKSMKSAPPRAGGSAVLYDSVIGYDMSSEYTYNTKDPSIFVVFRDAAAYPEYIITFRNEPGSGSSGQKKSMVDGFKRLASQVIDGVLTEYLRSHPTASLDEAILHFELPDGVSAGQTLEAFAKKKGRGAAGYRQTYQQHYEQARLALGLVPPAASSDGAPAASSDGTAPPPPPAAAAAAPLAADAPPATVVVAAGGGGAAADLVAVDAASLEARSPAAATAGDGGMDAEPKKKRSVSFK